MSSWEPKETKGDFVRPGLSWMNARTPELFKNSGFQRWFMLIVVSLFVASLLSPNLLQHYTRYKLGDIAEEDIKAAAAFLVEDYLPTEKKRAAAAQAVPPAYDLDTTVLEQKIRRIQMAFSLMREQANYPEERKKDFETLLGISNLPEDIFRTMERKRFRSELEKGIVALVGPVMANGVMAGKAVMGATGSDIIVTRTHPESERRVTSDMLFDLNEASASIDNNALRLPGDFTSAERKCMAFIAQRLLQANTVFNEKETLERRRQARTKVTPIYLQVKKGEMIVREGERIQEPHLFKLRALERASRHANVISILLGTALLSAIVLKSLYSASLKPIKLLAVSNKSILFLCVMLVFTLVAAKMSLFIIDAVVAKLPSLDSSILLYTLPVASGAMLVSIFLNSEVAIVFSLPAAILSALLFSDTLALFVYFLIGSTIASKNVSRYKERGSLLKAAMVVASGQALLIVAFNLSSGSLFSIRTAASIIAALVGGSLLGIVVIGLTPIIEIIFGYTTNFRLLEQASMDHPLLRELMLQAPGTYHHSVVVGSMVEAAAAAIGANSLLAKVSAYYHDIGKVRKPAYFIENQAGTENKHEKLAPSMSSLILISHVKDGVEMAKRHRLGTELIDVIRQHHGTSLITYFYEKAKNIPDLQTPPHLEDFRYPGPIPQTKEAGLVMLADAVEAASRTLNDPTPARLQGMVQKIINGIFADGQLNDCELTLRDMHQIAKSFTRILTGIFHHRIEYPESAAKSNGAKRIDADTDQQQAKSDKDKQQRDKDKGRETLKRLGSA
ncbi:MAG: HDIG domain-containing metalloprotein [Pseudomonadota bacterium]